MRFLSIFKSPEKNTPPSPQEMARMGKLVEDVSDGKLKVTDGPFSEAKEVVGGFAIFQVNSKEEALEHVKQFLQVVGVGECELRQLYDAG